MKKTAAQVRKPSFDASAALAFATGEAQPDKPIPTPRPPQVNRSKGLSGKVPEGDVRLTCNIRTDLHLKLKIAAATRQAELGKAFTVGELIEEMAEKYL